jgi:hypothetical protein
VSPHEHAPLIEIEIEIDMAIRGRGRLLASPHEHAPLIEIEIEIEMAIRGRGRLLASPHEHGAPPCHLERVWVLGPLHANADLVCEPIELRRACVITARLERHGQVHLCALGQLR